MSPPTQPTTGDLVLGRYRLEEIVGRGGVGVVFAATDEKLSRRVAVKVLRHSRRAVKGAEKRLLREAQTLAGLTHPHLVTLLDYGMLHEGAPVMVMELIEGLSLQARLKTGSIPPLEAARLLHQTAGALAACHEKGIIHRDLKPGNLILVGPPGAQSVKVIDFGIVRLIADDNATALTVNGEVFGSPRFMAPEQWLQSDVDARTDIYALGLLGYCMLLGDHFIKTTNPVEVFEAHMKMARPDVQETPRGERVPVALSRLLAKAAAADINTRFSSARELEAALRAVLNGGAVLARPAVVPDELPDEAVMEVDEDSTRHSVPIEIDALPNFHVTPAPIESVAPDPDVLRSSDTKEPVRLSIPGGDHTSITGGDVHRALLASTPAAAITAPAATPAPTNDLATEVMMSPFFGQSVDDVLASNPELVAQAKAAATPPPYAPVQPAPPLEHPTRVLTPQNITMPPQAPGPAAVDRGHQRAKILGGVLVVVTVIAAALVLF